MPSSLRLLATFVVVSALIAIGSVVVLKEQGHARTRVVAERLAGGSVDAGKLAFTHMGCGACHAISFAPGADGQVGPPLDTIATRVELAGHLANTPENMRRWIQHPQQVDPGNGMPDTGVDDRSAKDISAYLYTLKQSQ